MRFFAIFCLLFVVAVAVNADKELDNNHEGDGVLPLSRIKTTTTARPTVTPRGPGAKVQCWKICSGSKRRVPCFSHCPRIH